MLGGMGHETAQSNLVRTQVFGEKDDVVAVDRALAGVVGWSRAPCKVVNRHIPVVKAAAQRVTEAKATK